MLTTNRRTKKMILTDWREIWLTNEQYKSIRADVEIKSYNDIITIADADDRSKIIYDWKVSAIKEFQDIETYNYSWKWFFCEYWHFHSVNESCEHHKKYSMSPFDFSIRVYQKFWINYPSKVTLQHRKEILW